MTYLLDANVWIDALRGSDPNVIRRMNNVIADDVRLSSIVLGELRLGVKKRGSAKQYRQVEVLAGSYELVGVGDPVAEYYADIRFELESIGQPIGSNDLWIAAQALANDLVLVTANDGEFSRVPSLKLENWRL